jgi:hypothetical protein
VSLNPKHLVGKRIVRVDMRPFKTGDRGAERTCHDPLIELDDGSVLRFWVEETESGDTYGIGIERSKRR